MSALIKDSVTRELIINSKDNLLFPEFEFDEIEKHKEEILEKSKLSLQEFADLSSKLLKYVRIVKNEEILDYKNQAFDIIGKIDEDDVIFIATALACNAVIWSDDSDFQKQNIVKISTTFEMVKNYKIE
jgi:predicted nucleic acid-binding protein